MADQSVAWDELDTQGPPSASDAAAHAMLEHRKLAQKVPVPTSDTQVRERLRHYHEPITLFGEREPDRRARLLHVLIDRHGKNAVHISHAPQAPEEDEEEDEEFYTEGSHDLLIARRRMAAFSLQRAKERLRQQRQESTASMQEVAALRQTVLEPLKSYTSLGTQVAAERPVSVVRFSPDASLLATGSWSGKASLWSIPNATPCGTMHAHEDRITGLAWHPRATIGQPRSAIHMATGAGDGAICTWSLESERPLSVLRGHEARVCRIAFHPMGDYLASASFDGTWRLWDVARAQELMLQEGHSREVYAIDFQGDGALVASGGLDAIGRVWDTRTGRTAMVLDGHAREILGLAFAPNGYQLVSTSGDDTARVWDLRMLRSLYTIPAHHSSVADVRFFRAAESSLPSMDEDGSDTHSLSRSGLYFATAGYDGLVKIWSADDWQLVKSLRGDAGKVMSVDISSDGQYVASGEWARTFKLWGHV